MDYYDVLKLINKIIKEKEEKRLIESKLSFKINKFFKYIIVKAKEFFCKHEWIVIDVPEWWPDAKCCDKCGKIIEDFSKFKTK